MPGWLDRWLKRAPPPSRLATLLAAYPPYEIPHPGVPRRLKLAQCRENLAYLLEHRERRLATFGVLLREFGIDLQEGLARADPRPLLDALERWAIAEWPGITIPGIGLSESWNDSDRRGADIGLSMLMDTAIVLGEVVLRRRPEFAWQLNLDPGDRGMSCYRRVVVMRPADPAVSRAALVLDFEDECVGDFEWLAHGNSYLSHPLGYTALEAISGGYDFPRPPGNIESLIESGYCDKADDHAEIIEEYGLPSDQIFVHGGFFLGWLIDRGLCNPEFAKRQASRIAAYRQNRMPATKIYAAEDGCLDAAVMARRPKPSRATTSTAAGRATGRTSTKCWGPACPRRTT